MGIQQGWWIGFVSGLLLAFQAQAGTGPRSPLILTYHDVVPERIPGTPSDFDVLIDAFETQMSYLKDAGYRTISLEEYYLHRTQGLKLDEKSVLITFDDGYTGQVRFAVPILRRLGFKAAFFIHTNFVDVPAFGGVPASRDHGSWKQWKRIDRDPLFEVESHTLSHRSLSKSVPPLNDVHLDAELRQSKQTLQRILKREMRFIAYPYGDHDARTLEFARRFYKMGFAFGDPEEALDPLFQVPRAKMTRDIRTREQFAAHIESWLRGGP